MLLDTLGFDNGALSVHTYSASELCISTLRLSGGGSQAHSVSAPAPASTWPGSLSFAEDLLLLFAAFLFMFELVYPE